IVVDFIDMAKAEHRQQLYDHMREIMATDRARHNILPLSKFGLMQITRQRVRPVLDIHTEETCPSCYGKGEIQPSLLFTDTLYEKLDTMINHMGLSNFIMYVHPYVEGYLKRGWLMSIYAKWRRSLGGKFKIIPDESLAYLQYRVVDSKGVELDLKEAKDMNAATAEKRDRKAEKRGSITDEKSPARKAVVPPKPLPSQDSAEPESEQPAEETAPAPMSKSKKRRARRKKAAENAAAAAAIAAEAPASASSARDTAISEDAFVATDAVAITAEQTVEAPVPVTVAEPETPKKKRRPRKKAATVAQEAFEAAVAEELPAEANPETTTEASVAPENSEASETPAKKRRRRKKPADASDAPASPSENASGDEATPIALLPPPQSEE
ncbi:MAG: ribonuclease E/G, partial [Muribaculaceae bacterium]|nr:ribonuclease E/G [Muribaculaceae bacterium]